MLPTIWTSFAEFSVLIQIGIFLDQYILPTEVSIHWYKFHFRGRTYVGLEAGLLSLSQGLVMSTSTDGRTGNTVRTEKDPYTCKRLLMSTSTDGKTGNTVRIKNNSLHFFNHF